MAFGGALYYWIQGGNPQPLNMRWFIEATSLDVLLSDISQQHRMKGVWAIDVKRKKTGTWGKKNQREREKEKERTKERERKN